MKKTILWIAIACVVIGSGIAIYIFRPPHEQTGVTNTNQRERMATTSDNQPQSSLTADGEQRIALGSSGGQRKTPGFLTNQLWVIPSTGDMEGLKEMLNKQPDKLNALVGGMHATMLHVAAYKGQPAIVEELLRRGAKVNLQTKQGHTPLYDCIDNLGTVEIAKMLLDAGADPTIADNDGKTPLQLAIEKNKTDIADLLRQYGAKK